MAALCAMLCCICAALPANGQHGQAEIFYSTSVPMYWLSSSWDKAMEVRKIRLIADQDTTTLEQI